MKKSMENRTVGIRFEQEMCNYLSKKGWWAHDMTQSASGQPADIICAKGNVAILIDCKVCANNRFPFSRVEPNQESAMKLWMDKGNTYVYFALKLNDDSVYMMSYIRYNMFVQEGKSSLNEEVIRKLPLRKDIFPAIERAM